jgi:prepilin-type N-terminal cleavage/methylation domain-containing protein
MKHKQMAGFTLTECLIAMLVLGIGALIMAQVYGAVAAQTKENEFINISLAEQMAYVEQRSGDDVEAVPVFGATPNSTEVAGHALDLNTYHVVISGGPAKDDGTINGPNNSFKYKYGVTMYVLYSRDINNNNSSTNQYAWGGNYDRAGDEEGKHSALRYKYLLPRPAGTNPSP